MGRPKGGGALGVWVSEWKPRQHKEGLREMQEAPRKLIHLKVSDVTLVPQCRPVFRPQVVGELALTLASGTYPRQFVLCLKEVAEV